MSDILKIKNLSIFSANKQIVKNINLEVSSKKPLILLGESGSGKSLIFDCIMGTLDKSLKTKGNIFLNGIDILKLDLKKRKEFWGKKIAFLPQEPWLALDPTMRVKHQIEEVHKYLHNNKEYKNKSLKNLDEVKLSYSKELYPFELSGGMAQRITIAITNAINANIILVDEPTKGLDKNLCKIIAEQLKKEMEKEKLIFVISHDFDLVKNLNLNVAIMKDGQIIEDGSLDDLRNNPKHKYTKKLFDSQVENWKFNRKKQDKHLVIKASNLSKSFGDKKLFKNLDISLFTKEITTIVAKSGTGKSTLGDILLKLQKADEGDIEYKDFNRLHYQKIYQDPISCFIPSQILKESFFDLIRLHNLNEKDLFDLIHLLELDKAILERFPNEVSGGELQRLSIIRVILLKPIFIFADEITSRLDLINQKEVMFLLKNIIEKFNISILLVTHDLEMAKKISDNLIFLEDFCK